MLVIDEAEEAGDAEDLWVLALSGGVSTEMVEAFWADEEEEASIERRFRGVSKAAGFSTKK
jgi:hypothetical protein